MRPIETQVENYLEYCEHVRGFTKQTMQSKRYILKRFINEIGKSNVKDITNEDFDKWRQQLMQSGEVSPQTVNNRAHHAIAMFKYLLGYQVELKININIIHDIKHEATEIGFYEPEVIDRAKAACKGLFELTALSVAYDSGMRLTEITNLKVEDISGTTIKVLGKGRKLRRTYITPETYALLQQWLSKNEICEGFVFPSVMDWDSQISAFHMRYVLQRPFKRIGIKDFHPHKLRHSFATTLVDRGADVLTVQSLLGHSNIKTTSRYLHVKDTKVQSEYQRLMQNNLVNPA